MSEQIPSGFFDRLSLRHWYKYLLYVSGVLLILVVVLGSKIPQSQVISFSLWTMSLSLFVWILDDIFTVTMTYYDVEQTKRGYRDELPDEVKAILWARQIIQFIVFIIWIVVAYRSFF